MFLDHFQALGVGSTMDLISNSGEEKESSPSTPSLCDLLGPTIFLLLSNIYIKSPGSHSLLWGQVSLIR